MVDGTHLSADLADDEKTSCQNGFMKLRFDGKKFEPHYSCRSRSGDSSLSSHPPTFFNIFLIQVIFKLSVKTFTLNMFNSHFSKGLHNGFFSV